jgi:hypothetical protein
VFVDRRRERLVLSWTECKSAPDLARLVQDFSAQQAGAGKLHRSGPYRSGAWRGIRREAQAGGVQTQVVQYDAASARLIEARVCTLGSHEENGLAERVLRAIEVSEPAQSCRRWRAFGLGVEVPPGFELAGTEVQPGSAAFRFERPRGPHSARTTEAEVRRLGLARAWFDGALERLLGVRFPKVTFEQSEACEYAGGPAWLASGWEEATRFERWLGRARRLRALAVNAPEENAVYVVTTKSPQNAPLDPRAFSLLNGSSP